MRRFSLRVFPALLAGFVFVPLEGNAQPASDNGGTHTQFVAQWQSEIERAAKRFGIPANWITAVMIAESNGKTELNGRPIISPKGAMGLMQLMPDTYKEMRRIYGLGDDPYAPDDNIIAGAAYLKLNFERFGYPGLFAAYNAGPDRYARSLAGANLPMETRIYLATVLRYTSKMPVSPPSVFVTLNAGVSAPDVSLQPGLFVPLSE